MSYDPENCGYCRKRGSACSKHGGTRTDKYIRKADRQPALNATEREVATARKRLADSESHIGGHPKMPAPEFADPYNCSMCCLKGALCDMHARYDRDQREKAQSVTETPKTYPTEPPPAPSGVKTTEQTIGQHRIVQIKVGDVIITIKEPIK